VGVEVQVSVDIPDRTANLQYLVAVLDKRLCSRAGKIVPQVLIQWSGWPESMATWEDEQVVKEQFPAGPAWGQAGSKGGEDVSRLAQASSKEKGVREPGRRNARTIKPNPRYIGGQWVASEAQQFSGVCV
jgi:hypothetical protein